MKPALGFLLGGAMILSLTGVALAQQQQSNTNTSGTASSETPSPGVTTSNTAGSENTVNAPGSAGAQAQMETSANAEVQADADKKLDRIRERAKNLSAKARATVEKKLAEISRGIDAEASANGDVVVAGRVAPEFGMTGEAFAAERSKLDAGLGDLVVAHTLLANTKSGVTAEQLFTLHREGLGWGQIAHGLSLRLSDVSTAVQSESNVAVGRTKADGRTATIHSSTSANVNASTGAHAAGTKVGTASSVGVDVKVGK